MLITKYIVYDPIKNTFKDSQEEDVDIHRYLMPSDILLFKKHHKHNIFSCKDEPRQRIEILIKGEGDMKEPNPLPDFSNGQPEIKRVNVSMVIHVDTLGLTFDRVMASYGNFTLNDLAERFFVTGSINY